MNFITLNQDNLSKEHICCSISDTREDSGLIKKKNWLKDRLNEGLVFTKLDARGKIFIEYIPAEFAWAPISADGYFYINCFWVSGSYKSKGFGKQLMESCIAATADSKGLVALGSKKKKPFLSDAAYLKKAGFVVCDTAEPYFELLVLKNNPVDTNPSFLPHARKPAINSGAGIDLFYTAQCPFAHDYAMILADHAAKTGINLRVHHLDTQQKARNHPAPWSTYSIFKDGRFVTHEILTTAKLDALAGQ
ncbi:MAG: YoaP domain-containing protein [Bacteroidales bacterium]|nr:YoaP domain-containing protein [Bacteroidales bacterium]